MKDLRDAAVSFARGAGAIIKTAYAGTSTIEHKGAVDLVTETDRAAEEHLLAEIDKRFPTHAIWAEESGRSKEHGPYRWVIDPLDGTTNFAHRLPCFAVLVAVQERQANGQYETVIGVTIDPLRDDAWVAERGAGAWLNDVPIRVSKSDQLINSVLATGFSYQRLFGGADNHREFCRLNLICRGVRRFGSAGIDLAYLACGRFDGYWEYDLNAWDLAPGVLLIQEAGGMVTALDGGAFELESGTLCASNGVLHQTLLDALVIAQRYPANSREGLKEQLPKDLAARVKL